MNTDMRTKALVWLWYLESVGCVNETINAKRYVPYRLTLLCTHKMLTLTHIEHTSTTLPVNETQDCDYYHQNRGTDQV
jgi:hypothetical protein